MIDFNPLYESPNPAAALCRWALTGLLPGQGGGVVKVAPARSCAEPGCEKPLRRDNRKGYCARHAYRALQSRQQRRQRLADTPRRLCACGTPLGVQNTSGRCPTCAGAALATAPPPAPADDPARCPGCLQRQVMIGGLCADCYDRLTAGTLPTIRQARLFALPDNAPVARPCKHAPAGCHRKVTPGTGGLCQRCSDAARRGITLFAA